MLFARTATLTAALALASCAALNVIHDPQSGLINRAQVPKLLQSVRCELVTFYAADSWRKRQFIATSAKDYNAAIRNFAFFPLDEKQLGVVFLDLKVVDTLAIPSGASATTINDTKTLSSVAKQTWHLGPNAADMNTYELNWSLVIPQNSTLALNYEKIHAAKASGGDFFPCYHNLSTNYSIEALANHEFPEVENFKRIYVDAVKPLAEWLIDSSTELDTALFQEKNVDPNNSERMYPAQMIYTFTVQVGVGADASFSLMNARWNPIALDISGSTQQTSMMTIYVNGYDAMNANGAKAGLIGIVQEPYRAPAAVPGHPPTLDCRPFCTRGTPNLPLGFPIPVPGQ
jgi:hypothetical protein